MFPNDGLVPEAICTALTKNNLVTEVRDFDIFKNNYDCNSYLKKLINAYSPISIPLILGIRVPYQNNLEPHAIAICGHKEDDIKGKLKKDAYNVSWKSAYISQIYANDDQWGPFVRINLKGKKSLLTPWTDLCKTKKLAKIKTLIIPVYPKIRISYDQIEVLVVCLNKLLSDTLEINHDFFLWDIQLHYSEKYKHKIRDFKKYKSVSKKEDDNFKYLFLSKSLPKYIWVATLYLYLPKSNSKKEFFSFIFDATGLVDTRLLLHVLCFIPTMRKDFISNMQNLVNENESVAEYFEIYTELFDGVLNIPDFII